MTQTAAPNRRLIAWFIGTTLFTFTVLMHITFPNLGGTGLRMPQNATVWMGFGVMMAIAMWPAARGTIRYSNFHIGLGLLLLALWLPFLWSWNDASLIALPRMLTVTAGAILLLGLAQLQLTRRDWWWLGFAILLGALLETALSYVQLYWLEPGNWLGYDVARRQPYGIFQQRNVLASFLVTGLAVSAWLLGEAWKSWQRAITLLAPLCMPAILWFNGSLTGWLAALIVIPMLLIHLRGLDSSHFKRWGGALVLGCLLAGVLWTIEMAGLPRSADSIANNTGARWHVYTHSLRMIAEHPLAGWGYGRFQHDFLYSFADWRAAQPINQPEIVEPYIRQTFSHPHNELLLWGVEGGLLPMLAILVFGGWALWHFFTHSPRGERLLLASLLTPLSLHSMTELPFYQSLTSWLSFLLLIHFASCRCWPIKEAKNRYTFIIKSGACVFLPLFILFTATHLHTLWKIQEITHPESETSKTDAISSIINPLGIPATLEFYIMTHQLRIASKLGEEGYINRYLKWADTYRKKRPSPEIFFNISTARGLLDNSAMHKHETLEIEHLFPASKISLDG
ncbi:O-antigen ligase family protein [Halomonas koreensis]|uniref:Wzy polymerase domain-containing protein n=1 Tax=Halomonas koreensis TaxID=245385 RepID=A0ABU1G053_9GAMM|nr:Wzy polymerase domain-containing protein [Halomonas koreensis]MDR5865953.1 Wzy polymerase domain-containing protein [Halomonas koreensis]